MLSKPPCVRSRSVPKPANTTRTEPASVRLNAAHVFRTRSKSSCPDQVELNALVRPAPAQIMSNPARCGGAHLEFGRSQALFCFEPGPIRVEAGPNLVGIGPGLVEIVPTFTEVARLRLRFGRPPLGCRRSDAAHIQLGRRSSVARASPGRRSGVARAAAPLARLSERCLGRKKVFIKYGRMGLDEAGPGPDQVEPGQI